MNSISRSFWLTLAHLFSFFFSYFSGKLFFSYLREKAVTGAAASFTISSMFQQPCGSEKYLLPLSPFCTVWVLQITCREQRCDSCFLLSLCPFFLKKFFDFSAAFKNSWGNGGKISFPLPSVCMCGHTVNWDFESSQCPECNESLRQPRSEQWIGAWNLGKGKKIMKWV